MKEEITGLKKKMIIEETLAEHSCHIYKGKYKDKDILLGQTGMGKRRAESAAKFILDHYHTTALVSLGISGALVEDLKIGDVALGKALYSEGAPIKEGQKTANPIYSNASLISIALEAHSSVAGLPQASNIDTTNPIGNPLPQVCSVTTAKPIGNPEEKLAIGKAYGAEMVDMESYCIARIASTRDIPFLSIRAISDGAKDALPPFEIFLVSGKLHLKKAIFYFLTHPQDLVSLFYLYRNSRRAVKNLTAFVDSFITRYEEN